MPSSLGFRGCAVFVVMSSFAVYLAATPLDPSRIKNVDLNSWIRHYEPALYDPEHFHAEHHRAKRNVVGGNPFVRLTIKGHDRIFKLKLTPDKSIFTEDVVVESTNGPIDFEPNSVYTGTLEDDDSAFVHGIITKSGLFDGSIKTNTEEFYVEPVSRYANNISNFHSIVYRERDVLNPSRGKPCASHTLHLNRMAKEKRYRNCPRARLKRWLLEGEAKQPFDETTRYWNPNNNKRFPFDQPIDEVNRTFTDASGLVFGSRNVNKRSSIDPKKTTCMLYLQADHRFFQKYGTEEACIEVMTRHVQRVNSIYKTTDFNQDGKPDNISFMVKRIKVHTTDALMNDNRIDRYRFPGNYGVEKFLELFSEEDYDAFCLAYMFTYRDFEMGTLGLAWTGDLKNAGGVCEKNGHYRGSLKSLNTGIVTLLNYGKHVPPAVSHVTLAHEIGHNFGSPHDPVNCTPGGEDGNFIMFARATSGDKKNNNHFSPCSLKSINPVLNFKARSPKGCFTEPQTSLCGNGVVEDGEECDCGWEGDCKDDCCWPQRKIVPIDEPPCRLRGKSICSPSQGPCCTSNCQLKFGNKCRDDNGCRDASFCDGHGPKCPPSINKPNKTICNNEFVCFMGECTGSICLAYGLESCQCIPNKNDDKTKACELCCKLPGDNKPCISSFYWNSTSYAVPAMYSKPGTPCNDYNGYCDVFKKCMEVDPSGPLATLRKMLLSEESIASFKRWIMDYWYAVALIILAVIGLLILSTKLLGKRPNVKVKSVTIIHSQTTETVRLPDGDGQVTVHPPLRSKLPLKRKVRNGKKLGRKPAAKKEAQNNNNNVNSPTKKGSPKKKMRVSAAVSAEESRKKTAGDTTAVIEIPPSKVKKSSVSRRKTKKKKEVIDYSGAQIDNGNDNNGKKGLLNQETDNLTDPVGKVQNWLLKSHQSLPKSKSTPACLTDKSRSPHKRLTKPARIENKKSQSIGNLSSDKDKVRLQVVYKPPFKFSVKLKKPEKQHPVVTVESRAVKKPRTAVLVRNSGNNNGNKEREKFKKNVVKPSSDEVIGTSSSKMAVLKSNNIDDIDSNIHTVQSDLDVLLSESEFLFSDS